MTIEIMAMICALFFMFAAVLAKVTTVRLLLRMKQLIKNVQEQRAELVRELRDITAERTIAERNKISIERILAKREKKLRTLQRELREFANEDERKKTKREEAKKNLVR
ncbi:MAG: septal ring factor EnvC (AmiA/AmiB activator) [Candidatus Latescibacterota bacterium]|jgi:septal ring factor EnvC (AmiA/AmiB activator)